MEIAGESLTSATPPVGWRAYLEHPGVPEFLLVVLTLFVYARSLSMGFVYDDHTMVDNPWTLSWKDIPTIFTEDVSSNHASNFYRPLIALWTGLVHMLAGTNPLAWHLSGILLHLLCVVLVFRLACSLLNNRALATFAAVVFALHPTHVEAVTWVSDAADPLMTVLMLLSALALLRWLKRGGPTWWVASWLLAGACCFVKETGVLVPALLLVLALTVEHRVGQPAILLTGFSFVLSACCFLVLRNQVLHGFAHPLSDTGNLEMVLTLPAALCFYLSHLLFPVRLGPFYSVAFVSNWRSEAFLVPFLVLVMVLIALGWSFKRLSDRRLFWFCSVWVLAPLGAPLYLKLFPQFELVHDRYLYIPSIALGVALAAGLKKLSGMSSGRIAANALTIATAALVVAAAAETILYQGVWRSDAALFQRAVELTPNNARALVNLGVAKLQQGNNQEGAALLNRALEIQPDNAFALFDLGNLAWMNNDTTTAEAYFQRAVAIEMHPEWLIRLANAELKLNKLPEAEFTAQKSLEIDPSGRGAHSLLGRVHFAQGDMAAAVREFSAELQITPADPAAQTNLQLAQERLAQQRR